MIDEHVMNILVATIMMKFDQINAMIREKEMEKEVIQTIEMAAALSSCRSQSDLVKNCKEILPEYFGFEGAGMLLRDVKTDFLFSINELSKDETEMILRKEFRDA